MKKSMKLLAMALAGTFVLSGCADNADKQTSSTGTAASTTAALQTAAETTAKALTKQKVPRKLLTNPPTLPKTATILLSVSAL